MLPGWPPRGEAGSPQASPLPPHETKVVATSVGDRARRGSPSTHGGFLGALTSGTPLGGPRAVLGAPLKASCWGRTETFRRQSGRKQRDPLDFGPPRPCGAEGVALLISVSLCVCSEACMGLKCRAGSFKSVKPIFCGQVRKCSLCLDGSVDLHFSGRAFYPPCPPKTSVPRPWCGPGSATPWPASRAPLGRVGPWARTRLGDITVKCTGLAHTRSLSASDINTICYSTAVLP